MPLFPTLDALDQSLAAGNINTINRKMLLSFAAPSVQFVTKNTPDDAIPVGSSKIGGAPDLPKTMAWPMRGPSSAGKSEVDGLLKAVKKYPSEPLRKEIDAKTILANTSAPLAFVLQLDLAECAKKGKMDADFPTTGHFYLFYDFVFKPWYAEGVDGGGFRLIYSQAPFADLVRQPPPDMGFPLYDTLAEYRNQLSSAVIDPAFSYTLPSSSSYPMMVRYSYPRQPPHEDWLEKNTYIPSVGGQLGGWPYLIQYDPAIDLGTSDAGMGKLSGDNFISEITKLPGPIENWVTLIELTDYDSPINDFNGIYLAMIRRSDLKNRDFSKAVFIYQTD